MTDNVLYGQPASGATIATDEVAGAHIQKVKLVDGTADSGTIIPGSALGLAVDVRSSIPIILDPAFFDSFGRLQVSEPTTLFDSQFQYDLNPLLWQAITASGGTVTHLPNESTAQLNTTTANGSLAALQTYEYFRYQPGKSQLILMTFVMGAAQTLVKRRAGYFDANDGLFLEQNGLTDVVLTVRSSVSGSPVDTRVAQADWNFDKLDGMGVSGITLDLSKAQIFVVSFQWLGVGRVRMGFISEGKVNWVHDFHHANLTTAVYMKTGNLPLRYEMSAVTGASAATMKCICQSVISEGGFEEERGLQFSACSDATATQLVSNAALTPMLAIRLKATFNSIVNRGKIIPVGFDILEISASALQYQIIYNPTIVGGAWVSAGAESLVEYNRTITSFSAGQLINSGYVSSTKIAVSADEASRFPITLDVNGANPVAILIALISTATNNMQAMAAATWRELR